MNHNNISVQIYHKDEKLGDIKLSKNDSVSALRSMISKLVPTTLITTIVIKNGDNILTNNLSQRVRLQNNDIVTIELTQPTNKDVVKSLINTLWKKDVGKIGAFLENASSVEYLCDGTLTSLNNVLKANSNEILTAFQPNWYDALNKLIEYGLDIDVTNLNGETHLILACKHCQPHKMLKLLESGANVNHKTNNGFTVFELNELFRNNGLKSRDEIKVMLLAHGAIEPND